MIFNPAVNRRVLQSDEKFNRLLRNEERQARQEYCEHEGVTIAPPEIPILPCYNVGGCYQSTGVERKYQLTSMWRKG